MFLLTEYYYGDQATPVESIKGVGDTFKVVSTEAQRLALEEQGKDSTLIIEWVADTMRLFRKGGHSHMILEITEIPKIG